MKKFPWETLGVMPHKQHTSLLRELRKQGFVVEGEETTRKAIIPGGRVVWRSMRHSNRKQWLVRCEKGLVTRV